MKQEWTHRTPPSGHTASDIGSRGVHTFEGREAFLAQPLATSEEEIDAEQGVRGAAYARTTAGTGNSRINNKNNNNNNNGQERGQESSSDEEVSLDFQTISAIRRSQELADRPVPGTSTNNSTNNNNVTTTSGAAKGRGAMLMRNHEAQRFASTPAAAPTVPTTQIAAAASNGPYSPARSASTQDVDRARQLDRAVAAQEAGESSFQEVDGEFEETDL